MGKKTDQNRRRTLLIIHLLSAFCYSAFLIFQTNLITQLENNKLQYSLFFITIAFLAAHVISEVIEASFKEDVFSRISTSEKKKLSRQYLFQPHWKQMETGQEKHLAFFQNKITTVLLQYEYLGLYLQKQIILLVLSVATLLFLSWPCFVAIVIVLAVSGLVSKRFSGSVQKKQAEYQKEAGAFSNYIMEAHQGFDEIHLQQMHEWAEHEFSRKNESMENAKYRYQRGVDRVQSITVAQNMMIYILILLIGSFLAIRGIVGIGVFVSCAELSVFIINSWNSIQNLYIKRQGSKALKDELDHAFPSEKKQSTFEKNYHAAADIQDISFGYEKDHPLWSDLSFRLASGEKVLVVGTSGSGKSTLLKVLSGYYIPQAGKIHCADKTVYVPQTPFLFEGTLKENLVFDRPVDEQRIKTILEKLKLPLALDLHIDENGRNLSGGQCARVALARALLYEPDLLLLDEVTSQLDENLGRDVESLLLNEYPRTAMVVVAHRTYFRDLYDQVVSINEYA